jgi:riboflavin biosynthesis pyrimidine reductase
MAGRGAGLPIEPIWQAVPKDDRRPRRGGALPPQLAARYPGELSIGLDTDRPTIVANFVSSVDGVVALAGDERSTGGGGEISGNSEPDRFMMALLRSLSDAVIVGAGTVRVGRNHEWTPRKLHPDLAPAFAEWRARLGLQPQPTTVVVTSSGALDFGHRGLSAPDVPVVVATTEVGARRLATLELPRNVTVAELDGGDRVTAQALVGLLATRRVRLALCEGGPRLFAGLLAAERIDALFLTVAPQLIGRPGDGHRLGLTEGADFLAAGGRWARLAAVRRAGDDLFLRYRFEREHR